MKQKGGVICAFLLFCVSPSVWAEQVWDIGRIDSGQSLYSSLEQKKVSSGNIHQIVTGLKPHMDFGRIRPNTAYHFVLDPMGKLQEFAIEWGGGLLHLYAGPEKYAVRRWKVPRRLRVDKVSGRFENDIREAFRVAGESGDLSDQFSEILLGDSEPAVELKKGDRFRLVVEKIHAGQWLLRYGRIEAFELQRDGYAFLAIRFKDEFYDDTGTALKNQFLRFPLDYHFVSSEFKKSRSHPILGGVRPHRGIDLVAPVGTPVWAIAEGQVVTAGSLGGYGITVIVKHAHGYESLYAHLSGFAPGIEKGVRVLQKQVIGYIGTTGLSTGPHLHYELRRDGQHRDPLKESFPRAVLARDEEYWSFEAKKSLILSILENDEHRLQAVKP
jgi:murein DD-endopeptidase MepM/ murein hydrolase activator NlpD